MRRNRPKSKMKGGTMELQTAENRVISKMTGQEVKTVKLRKGEKDMTTDKNTVEEKDDFKETNKKPITPKDENKVKATAKKKIEAKPKEKKEKQLSNIPLMKQMLKDKLSDEEIVKAFTKRYKEKGVTDTKFIEKRVAIYRKIAQS